MAIKVDGTAVTGEVAGWATNGELDPMADQPVYTFNAAMTSATKSAPTSDNPPGYSTTGFVDGATGFAGSGATGPLGAAVTLTAADALGISVAGGAAAASTKEGVATTSVNGSGENLTVDLTVTKDVGVTAAAVKAVGSGYVNNEQIKVAKADAGTTNDVILYVKG